MVNVLKRSVFLNTTQQVTLSDRVDDTLGATSAHRGCVSCPRARIGTQAMATSRARHFARSLPLPDPIRPENRRWYHRAHSRRRPTRDPRPSRPKSWRSSARFGVCSAVPAAPLWPDRVRAHYGRGEPILTRGHDIRCAEAVVAGAPQRPLGSDFEF